MDTSSSPYHPNARFTVTLPLPSSPLPTHVPLKDDKVFNLPTLNKLPARHHWRNCVPKGCLSNVWTLTIDDEEPITASGAIDALNFMCKNHLTTCAVQFHKRTTCPGTLLNDYRYLFDRFERPRPNKIHKSNDKKHAIMNEDEVFTPESHYVVDSAIPITKLKFYTDTFASQFS